MSKMSSVASPPKPARVGREGGLVLNDGADLRGLSFGRGLSSHHCSNSRQSPSDHFQTSRHEASQSSSSSDFNLPSSKKQKQKHVKVESLIETPSEAEKIQIKVPPNTMSSIHPESGHSAHPSLIVSTIGPSDAGYPCAQDNKTTELRRLKQELLAANSKIALQEQELAHTRVIKHTLDQALGSPSEADFGDREITEQTIAHLQSAFNASNHPFGQFQDAWNVQDDSQSDISDALSAGAYNRARGLWNQHSHLSSGMNTIEPSFDKQYDDSAQTSNSMTHDPTRLWGGSTHPAFATHGPLHTHRVLSGPLAGTYGFYSRSPDEQARFLQGPNTGARGSATQSNRGGTFVPSPSTLCSSFVSRPPSEAAPESPSLPTARSSSAFPPIGIYSMPSFHTRPVATALSPTATEFTTTITAGTPWATSLGGGSSLQTYVSPLEPLNYRRLLDKNVSCDWKYIVDKIVCNNDQQASIFLQQKLKVGMTEQKYDIVDAIVSKAYSLMINRFGNFLVQRCFEHGSPEQVVAIANAIRGHTLNLSMDPFGCHVIQKAFDCVPEEHKAVMVHELLCRIPETVIHRYACHVWQKLFELRWSGAPPQVMAKVNEALRGMWHEVALGETGSLVVQNIFENCVEEEKRLAIEEVLGKVDVLAHGQFGNWCIQHICEHGAPHDKGRAIEHVLHFAVDYSMDQFASKIVEKCLKIGGSEFLDRYLSRVCIGRADRPRMPLIDIAGDQYGNYLIQWILMNAATHQREIVASHIRKHMVSLRGSKFGSRVAMLCCNPSHATRPGPGTGMHVGRFNQFNEERFPSNGPSGGRLNRGNQWGSAYTPFR
ncbi:hypothetical protein N7526_005459 [Penicillium atrosanguineum]|nr:hypothetical protein N7526_005459 [Penicillium atrosanguineum]